MLTEILPHLVQRPEDFLENVQERIAVYKDTMLHPLEVKRAWNLCYHIWKKKEGKREYPITISVTFVQHVCFCFAHTQPLHVISML